MKKLFTTVFIILISLSVKAQMISVSGGSLNLHDKDKGFIEVEAMQHISHKLAAHVSYTKTIGGYDIAMVGGRYGLFNDRVGAMLSACYMENHPTMTMWGVDVRLSKDSPIRVVYSQSSDRELSTIGIKFPLFNKH